MPLNSDKNSGFMGMKQKDNVGWRNPVAGCAAFSGARGREDKKRLSSVPATQHAVMYQKNRLPTGCLDLFLYTFNF